ncbi:DNA-3-methyladenine glycosylase 1-like [Phragmites australis]|uniref:DNA-3-methyladenine glycosylase 1-like n=1 Tax=Phragmites australis TaxID=29695 RepID=UPI002D7815A5|nr:DNA-3-methyladenine glycosylase 1-like [Phragmites australis]XP_062232229.1 DNA-3-methyladenine glycosylase 1-like [Phragmites australis]
MGEQSLSQLKPQPPSPSPPAPAAASRTKKAHLSSDPSASNPPKKPRPALSLPGRPLSADGEVAAAIRHLRAADPTLAAVIDAHEPPAFHCPHRPFHSLARSILYQQLAFKAAASVYSRFLALLGGEASVVPDAVLALTPHQLRQIGVSPRKASYLHDLARKYVSGILSDASIVNMDDRSLAAMLTMVKGIGAWSVHMFMIFSLARPDVLPSADLGVRKGVQMLYRLEDVPRPSQMEKLCERWRPFRSVGAWYMWRLIESKAPQPAPAFPVGPIALPAPNGQLMLQQHQHQQQQQQQQQTGLQMIDPLQMLPGMG